MALTIVWRNPLPLIRTERTLQRHISHEFGAVDGVTAPDLMTELDAIIGIVEHGLVLDMTQSALINSGEQIIDRTVLSPRLVSALLPPRAPQTSGSSRW